MKGAENERLRRALERLMNGQREALEVLRQTLDDDVPTEDARTILGIDERSSGT